MKFIIDGDGTVEQCAATDLLTDIMYPYWDTYVVIVTGAVPELSEDMLMVIKNLVDNKYAEWNQATSVLGELSAPAKDKIFIVADAATRPQCVNYCVSNGIMVLDLVKGLYPVTEKVNDGISAGTAS